MSSEIIFGNEIELVPILKVFSDIKPNSLKMIQIRNLHTWGPVCMRSFKNSDCSNYI